MAWLTESGTFHVGWDEVVLSLNRLLTTRLATRNYRRDFGSELLEIVDAPMNLQVMMRLHHAVAKVVEPRLVKGSWYGEPRFKLTRIELSAGNASGEISVQLFGQYLPNGHKGDNFVANESVSTAPILLAA